MQVMEKEFVAKLARVFRAENNCTQHELANICGISQQVLSYLEKCSWDKVSVDNIAKVRDKLFEHELKRCGNIQ